MVLAAGAGTRMKSDTPKGITQNLWKTNVILLYKEALKLSDDITVVLFHQASKSSS